VLTADVIAILTVADVLLLLHKLSVIIAPLLVSDTYKLCIGPAGVTIFANKPFIFFPILS
jgi:hypothetical protein